MMQMIHPITNRVSILIAIVLSTIAMFFLMRSCNDNEMIAVQSKSISDKRIDLSQVQQWKDKYNTLHFKLQTIEVEKEVLQVYSDSIAKVLKIKSKQISSIAQIKSAIILDQKLTTEKIIDTIDKQGRTIATNYTTFSYKDQWMIIKGDVGKTDRIHIEGRDTLTKIDYQQRKWFLGKKRYYSDFSNKNPYIYIEGLKQIETKTSIDRWGIGPSIQMSARLGDKIQIFPTIGISLQYNIITF